MRKTAARPAAEVDCRHNRFADGKLACGVRGARPCEPPEGTEAVNGSCQARRTPGAKRRTPRAFVGDSAGVEDRRSRRDWPYAIEARNQASVRDRKSVV